MKENVSSVVNKRAAVWITLLRENSSSKCRVSVPLGSGEIWISWQGLGCLRFNVNWWEWSQPQSTLGCLDLEYSRWSQRGHMAFLTQLLCWDARGRRKGARERQNNLRGGFSGFTGKGTTSPERLRGKEVCLMHPSFLSRKIYRYSYKNGEGPEGQFS